MNNIITIDGPSGAGKTTVAKMVAEKLELPYIPSGKLFRAVAYLTRLNDISAGDSQQLRTLLSRMQVTMEGGRVMANGQDITQYLDDPAVGLEATRIAQVATVRQHLLDIQQTIGRKNGCVIEGRSTAIEVFPEAATKIWLTAWPEIRSQRKAQAEGVETSAVISKRDRIDRQRQLAPMQQVPDAHMIDSSELTLPDVVQKIIDIYSQREITLA